jgi:PAS domain S-box-containing protein
VSRRVVPECRPRSDIERERPGLISDEHDTGDSNAPEELNAQESDVCAMFEKMPEAIVVHEPICSTSGFPTDYVILAANPAFEKETGLCLDQVLRQPASTFYRDADPPVVEVFSRVALSGKTERIETCFGQDNRRFDMSVYSTGGGQLISLMGPSDRAQPTSRAFASNSEIFRGIFNNAAVGIVLVDSEGRYLQANAVWTDMIGYSREELLGLSYQHVTHPYDLEHSLERHEALVRGDIEQYRLEKRYVKRDGTVFWADLCVSAIRNRAGEMEGTVVIIVDVTERKQAEEQLRLSEHRYKSLVERVPYGIVIIEGLSGQFLYINRKTCELLGMSEKEIMEKSAWDFIHPDEHDAARQRILERLADIGAFGEPHVYTCIAGDGSWRRLEISAARLSFRGREALQSIIRDVTEQELTERQLQHAQKMEAVGTLAGGVAHEFNNILMAIRGYTQLLSLSTELPPNAIQYMSKIDESTERAANLTGKMLTFSRLEAGEKVAVHVGKVVSGVQQLLRQTLPRRIDIEAHVGDDLPEIFANPNQLEQVLLNLSVNARDAIPNSGKITFRARLCEGERQFRRSHPWAQSGAYVELTVEDTGQGMTEDVLQRIFEPFFTTKEPGRGTGLGLSVAYSMIKNHGGNIAARSQSGHGSCFSVFLPVHNRPMSNAVPAIDPAPPTYGKGESILIVDDEESVREICKNALESFGYNATVACDGLDALEVYKAAADEGRPFSLVLLDLAMPVMDGKQCLDRIFEIDPDARVIYATGYGGEQEEAALDNPRVKSVLRKPFDLNALLRQVSGALQDSPH